MKALGKALEKKKEMTPERVIGNPSKSDKYKIVRKPGYRYSLEKNK